MYPIPLAGIARTIWGDHQRYKETYFSAFPSKYFTGDGALRDEVGYYRITGRVDDVIIVSGHNLGTAPIEDSINLHPAVAESAIVGYPHDIKGNALYGYVILKETGENRDKDNLKKEINLLIADSIAFNCQTGQNSICICTSENPFRKNYETDFKKDCRRGFQQFWGYFNTIKS